MSLHWNARSVLQFRRGQGVVSWLFRNGSRVCDCIRQKIIRTLHSRLSINPTRETNALSDYVLGLFYG